MLILGLILGFLFVIIASIFLELAIRNTFIVSGIIAIIALIVYAFLPTILTLTFIIWIIIYALTSLIVGFLTDYYNRRNRNNNCF